MSLLNAACCCATTTGRCCILDTTAPGVDCVDLCVDNKTPAQCAALGGVWETGACADVDPAACVGVCCATNAAGYFVACQEGVTQCECFSENLATGVVTNWTSGANLTCADIACPCRCADSCTSIQLIGYSETRSSWYSPCGIICRVYVNTDDFTPNYVGVLVSNNGEDCNSTYWIDYWISLLTSSSLTKGYCDLGETGTNAQTTEVAFATGAVLGAVLTTVNICNAPLQNVVNLTHTQSCTADHPSLSGQCVCTISNQSTSVPVYWARPYCRTCDYENCIHVYDDCENC